MKTALSVALTLGLVAAAAADSQTFFFHHSDTPVPVPGGTTMCFLDETAPTATTPFVIQDHVARDATASFPACIAPAFGSDVRFPQFASVRLNLSAGQHGTRCIDLAVGVSRVDGGGGMTSLGAAGATGVTLPEAAQGGAVGFVPFRFEFPLSDRDVHAGESVAVTASATDHCRTDRDVDLALDAAGADTRVTFQCCVSTAAKCAATKIAAAGAKAGALTKCFDRAVAKGLPLDPGCAAKADMKFLSAFAKAEEKGACPTTGDATSIESQVGTFAATIDGQLAPTAGPSKCTAGKLLVTGKKSAARAKCAAKAIVHARPVEPACLQAADGKFALGFAKAESAGDCLAASGDATAIEASVDTFVDGLVAALQCPCQSPSGAFLDAPEE